MMVKDKKYYLTREHFNKSDDTTLSSFSENTWKCIDAEKREYCFNPNLTIVRFGIPRRD